MEFSHPISRAFAVLPLFSDLSPADLSRMALGCELRRLGRATLCSITESRVREFHVVVTGQVKLFALSQTGQEKAIELVGRAIVLLRP